MGIFDNSIYQNRKQLERLKKIQMERELKIQNMELFGGNSRGDISHGVSKSKKKKDFGDCSNYDSGGF